MTQRRRGASLLTVGSALSGVLAYVYFALVTRGLGAAAAAPVSMLWTYWSFVAAALTFPIQHWIIRTVAAAGTGDDNEGGVRGALPGIFLTIIATSSLMVGISWLGRSTLFHREDAVFPLLIGLVSFLAGLTGVVRGVLTARGRFSAVGWVLFAENAARVLIAAVLLAVGSTTSAAFGFALAIGAVSALCWPSALMVRGPARRTPWAQFVAGASGGQLLSQSVLVGGPLALAFIGGTPSQVTALFVALALFRAPYTLALGAVSALTGFLTQMVTGGRAAQLKRSLEIGAASALTLSAAAGALGWLIGPWLMRLVFGPGIDVPADVAALTAAGSALATCTLVLSVTALAADQSHAMLLGWIGALLSALVILAVLDADPLQRVAIAFVAAQAVAFVIMWRADRSALARAAVASTG